MLQASWSKEWRQSSFYKRRRSLEEVSSPSVLQDDAKAKWIRSYEARLDEPPEIYIWGDVIFQWSIEYLPEYRIVETRLWQRRQDWKSYRLDFITRRKKHVQNSSWPWEFVSKDFYDRYILKMLWRVIREGLVGGLESRKKLIKLQLASQGRFVEI